MADFLGFWFIGTLLSCLLAGIFFLRLGGRTWIGTIFGSILLTLTALGLWALPAGLLSTFGVDQETLVLVSPAVVVIWITWWVSKLEPSEFDWRNLSLFAKGTGIGEGPNDILRQPVPSEHHNDASDDPRKKPRRTEDSAVSSIPDWLDAILEWIIIDVREWIGVALDTIAWQIARNCAGLIGAFILLGTPIIGTFALAAIAWYATGKDFGLTMLIWFVLMIYGSLSIYHPYLQPMTIKVIDQILEWVREENLKRREQKMRRKGIALNGDDSET